MFNEVEQKSKLQHGLRKTLTEKFSRRTYRIILFSQLIRDFASVAYIARRVNNVTYFSLFVELWLKLSSARESPLHGPSNFVDRAWERPASYSVLTLLLSRETKTLLLHTGQLMTEVARNAKLEEDVHQTLEESLSLLSVVQLKAKLTFITMLLTFN